MTLLLDTPETGVDSPLAPTVDTPPLADNGSQLRFRGNPTPSGRGSQRSELSRLANQTRQNGRRNSIARAGGWKQITIQQAFLVPVVVVFVFLFLIPLIQSFRWSLTDFTGFSLEANFVGLANYRQVFSDPALLAGVGFTLLFTLARTVLVTVLAIPLAVALNKKFFGRNFVRSVLFFPSVVSMVVLGFVWGFILSPLSSGVVNSLLTDTFGIGAIPWTSTSGFARFSVIMVGVWGVTGWHTVLYLAYLQSIGSEYYEAADIDGASKFQQFRYITLPLLMPAVVLSNFLLMTSGLQVFDLPFALTNGGPGFATRTITQSIVVTGLGQGRYGLASALAVLFMLAVAGLSFAQMRIMKRLEGKTQ